MLVCVLLVAVSVPVATSSGLTQPSQTVTATLTTVSTYTTTLLDHTYNIRARVSGCGTFGYDPFNATAGSISGIVSSNYTEISFTLVSRSDFNAWALQPDGSYVGRDCIGPRNPIVSHHFDSASPYSFSANLPSKDEYIAIFINTPADSGAKVSVSIYSAAVYTVTTTVGGNPLTNIPGFPFESILLGSLLALVILIVNESRKTRRH